VKRNFFLLTASLVSFVPGDVAEDGEGISAAPEESTTVLGMKIREIGRKEEGSRLLSSPLPPAVGWTLLKALTDRHRNRHPHSVGRRAWDPGGFLTQGTLGKGSCDHQEVNFLASLRVEFYLYNLLPGWFATEWSGDLPEDVYRFSTHSGLPIHSTLGEGKTEVVSEGVERFRCIHLEQREWREGRQTDCTPSSNLSLRLPYTKAGRDFRV
jgi:hypothetical protein